MGYMSALFGRRLAPYSDLLIVSSRVAGTIGGLLRRSSCPWSVPLNFGIVFVLGGAIMAGCTVRYVFMRLPDADAFPTERAAAPGDATVIREISSDRDFGVFLAVAALVSLAVQAELFLVPYGLERFSLGRVLGRIFTSAPTSASA